LFRAAAPGWDNTPRRAVDGLVLRDNSPASFEEWVATLLVQSAQRNSTLLFINAWNEWGEGAYLEPDEEWGTSFLEAHRRARMRAQQYLEAGNDPNRR
jgi:hypothetical protein